MIQVKVYDKRGHFQYDWLHTYHTFSFGQYYDPDAMGFHSLRVLNEDRVMPDKGFPTHSHDNMEILTLVLKGVLEHKDSMGEKSVLQAGQVQLMSAGTGITHSEYNASSNVLVHFLQIWITPDTENLSPRYQERDYRDMELFDEMHLVASPDGRDGSMQIHQDAFVYRLWSKGAKPYKRDLDPNRNYWLQVAAGRVQLGADTLEAGDAASFENEKRLEIVYSADAEFLLFDLA